MPAPPPPPEESTIYATRIIVQMTISAAEGWTGKVLGVDSTNIAKICGVPIADISKVCGV